MAGAEQKRAAEIDRQRLLTFQCLQTIATCIKGSLRAGHAEEGPSVIGVALLYISCTGRDLACTMQSDLQGTPPA